jgi:GT2 family glycosyltransferase
MTASSPQLSIVIPVGNHSPKVGKVLQALAANDTALFEVILVADRVCDDSLAPAAQYPYCRVINDPAVVGVSAARNRGAREARAPVIAFIDSDILVKPDTIPHILEHMNKDGVDGMVGLLSPQIPYPTFPSHFKNLWMRWTYDRLPDTVSLFYTSLAVIRKSYFDQTGGFDEHYQKPSIEDTDLGGRLTQAGAVIHMAKDLEVVHDKSYTMWSLLRTDFARSVALVRFALRDRFRRLQGRNTTAVPSSFIVHLGMGALLVVALAILAVTGEWLWAGVGGALITLMWLANGDFLGYLKRHKGWLFAMGSALFLILQALVCLAGIGWGMVGYVFGKRY